MINIRVIKLKLRTKWDESQWKRFNEINNNVWRAANEIAGGQYWNDVFMRKVYNRLRIDPKDKDKVQEAEDLFKEYFGVKRQATTEHDIKMAFPMLPPCVTNPLNQLVVSSYKANKKEMLIGNQSLRTYRRGMPIPVTKTSVKLFSEDGTDGFLWTLKRGESLQFTFYYGRDRANYKESVRRILAGEYDYSAPQIQRKDRDLFLLLPVKEPKTAADLDPDRSVGVDLGVSVPAYVALSDGLEREAIGSAEDFLRVRTKLQRQRRNLQRGLKMVPGGHGRKKKLKGLDKIKAKERAFVQTYNHMVSKRVVDFAVRNRSGTIKMEFLKGFRNERENNFILRNWSYFDLQQKIKYKAKIFGIAVVTVDPYHTSQTCSVCGNYEEGQRNGRKFVCKACGKDESADYNAAVNIARSTKIVIKREQCQFFKNNNAHSGVQPCPRLEGEVAV